MADDKPRLGVVHSPVPYIVTLRVVVDQDQPPTRIEAHVTAYSLIEAVEAAFLAQAGRFDKGEYLVEAVEPDMPAFMKMIADQIAVAAAGRRR